jgi:hypothetical protein
MTTTAGSNLAVRTKLKEMTWRQSIGQQEKLIVPYA